MLTYYSTFITGFEDLIEKALRKEDPGLRVKLLMDGLVVYQTKLNPEEVKRLPFLNNSFLLLNQQETKEGTRTVDFVKNLFEQTDLTQFNQLKWLRKQGTFRIVISKENQAIGIPSWLTDDLEAVISKVFKLKPDRSKPEIEFWFLLRREQKAFLGIRITHKSSDKREKGELRPELAYLLNFLSEPTENDVFLDPFAGSGIIPLSRTAIVSFKQLIVGDKDLELVKTLRKRLPQDKRIKANQLDALNLETIPDLSVDKIVTDPPWGFYQEKVINYQQMLVEFHRILKPKGILVLLIGDREVFQKDLETKKSLFKTEEQNTTLVSGKKAVVYKLRKE